MRDRESFGCRRLGVEPTDLRALRENVTAIVVIAASAGGLEPLRLIIAELPTPCRAAVFIVWHIGPHPSVLPSILERASLIPVGFARDRAAIQPGHIYVAPPDRHILLGAIQMRLSAGPKVHYARPAADPLFMSAAASHGDQVIGVVLSGGDGDGAAGLLSIKQHGGTAFVQDPSEATSPSMPHAAIAAVHPDAVLTAREIARRLSTLCSWDGQGTCPLAS